MAYRFRAQHVDDYATQLNFEQLSGALPTLGSALVTFSALAAGGIASGPVVASFRNATPTLVIAQLTPGGSIFFSNQYVIGTSFYTVNGFNVDVASGGAAFAAGWTARVNYIAYF